MSDRRCLNCALAEYNGGECAPPAAWALCELWEPVLVMCATCLVEPIVTTYTWSKNAYGIRCSKCGMQAYGPKAAELWNTAQKRTGLARIDKLQKELFRLKVLFEDNIEGAPGTIFVTLRGINEHGAKVEEELEVRSDEPVISKHAYKEITG